MTPHDVHRGFRWLPTVIIALVLLGGFIAVVQHFGFFLDTQDVKHQGKVGVIRASQDYGITQHSKAYQDAQIAIMDQRLSNILGPGGLAATRASLPAGSGEQLVIRASELSEIRYFCQAAQDIVPGNTDFTAGSPSLSQIAAANCLGASPAADPPLARSPVPDGGA